MSMNVGSWVLCTSVCLVGCLYITMEWMLMMCSAKVFRVTNDVLIIFIFRRFLASMHTNKRSHCCRNPIQLDSLTSSIVLVGKSEIKSGEWLLENYTTYRVNADCDIPFISSLRIRGQICLLFFTWHGIPFGFILSVGKVSPCVLVNHWDR